MTILEKARAGRLAALASLSAPENTAPEQGILSLFDFGPALAPAKVPAFRSVRIGDTIVRLAA